MTKKNTLSILENIKKKLNKFDEPKKSDGKNFSDLGDEFEYIDPNKKNEEENTKLPVSEPKAEHDVILEQEIENSFSEETEGKNHEEEAHEGATVEDEEDIFNLDNIDDSQIENEERESESEEIVNQDAAINSSEEPLEEDEDLFHDLDLEEENIEHEHEEDIKIAEPEHEESIEENFDDDFFEDEAHEEEDVSVEQNNVEAEEGQLFADDSAEENSNHAVRIEENEALSFKHKTLAEQHQDLDELLAKNDEKYIKKEEDNIDNWAKNDVSKADFTRAQTNQQQVVAVTNSILKQESMQKATDSMKKLIDAKNAVVEINAFTKSDNLSEIAMRLLEPRLEKWLNENLPQIVERIVQEEIKKIIPRS